MSLENKKIATSMDSWEGELSRLLEERMNYVSQVGLLKKQHGKEILDQAQWARVISNIQQLALDKGMNHEYVKDVWEQIHGVSLAIKNLIEYDGEIVDDESKYDISIIPLRKSIGILNEDILRTIVGIISINGEKKAQKSIINIIKSIDITTVVNNVINYSSIPELGVLYNLFPNGAQEKHTTPKHKGDVEKKYLELKLNNIPKDFTITLGDKNCSLTRQSGSYQIRRVVLIDNKIYFILETSWISGTYFDIDGNEMVYTNSFGKETPVRDINKLIATLVAK